MTLWQKLIRNCVKTPSGCWRWQGATDQDGYALVRVGKQVRRGHQVMWEIHNGRADPARAPAGPHLPANELYQPVSPRARDLRGEQEESLALSETGIALSQGPRDDAREHVPEACAEISAMQKMPRIVEGRTL